MMDLSTKYLGMKLRSPLVVSASPLSHEIAWNPPPGRCRSLGRRSLFAV